jgi:hypothetical protein
MPGLTVISLGWGVQSFTLAAMSALGDLPPVDFAIHADTTWERSATYEFAARWTPWLEEHGVKAVTVRADEAKRNPAYSRKKQSVFLPVYTKDKDDITGVLKRECTGEWKIMPMHRYIRSQGAKAKKPATQWIGISKDEWHRAKDSNVKYIVQRFPLLDLGMTRADCINWLERHHLEVPGKSSCTFCPFHNNLAWAEMKRENGHDWYQAVATDEAIRDKRPPYPLFVHRKCVPLPEAVSIAEDFSMTQPGLFTVNDMPCDSGYCFL